MMTLEQAGELAYTVYGVTVGGVNVRGEPLPFWADLGDVVQTGWIVVAQVAGRAVAGELDRPWAENPHRG